ncbi:hypothetical protein GCM10009557_20620 [Virgisporangium ochraceum]|uniref:Uncharacterized protein n=1 Tax=Virgisporangium ochraceum TaxID=65505 RepID=A0A8J3ZYS6_9ACTN|nr:hypothetical protein [Virgisporangium ochraceum]GIJ71347.1 hypothetical protein Voc01_062640 [Virgisporangium ochraceum]
MDEAEFWLLDVVVLARVRLDWLLCEDLEEALNRPGHGLDPDALLDLMDRLFRGGVIYAAGPVRNGDRAESDRPLPRSEIEAALDGSEPTVSYGMTSRGGALWEAVTRPDWSRFLDELAGTDPDEVEVSGFDRDRVAAHLRRHTLWPIVPDSERWEALIPWQATYWKTFPRGYRVTAGWNTEEPTKTPDWDVYNQWIRWYDNPYDARAT